MVMRLGLLLVLTACGAFFPGEAVLPSPPIVLMAGCPSLQIDPARELSQAEVEVMWGRDRTAARACAGRHAALASWVDGLIAEVGAR
jgi:hypothetical protein